MCLSAWEYAERDRSPVVLLLDGCLGTVMEEVELPPMKELAAAHADWTVGHFGESDGRRARRKIKSIYSEQIVEQNNRSAGEMYRRWAENDVRVEEYMMQDAEYAIVAYGTSARVSKYAINALRAEGVKVGLIRPITLFPFPKASLDGLDYGRVKAIIDVEMAIPAQMYDDIALQVRDRAPILTYGHSGGVTLNNEDTTDALRELIRGLK